MESIILQKDGRKTQLTMTNTLIVELIHFVTEINVILQSTLIEAPIT